MNEPSSRTPEGIPHRCDVCGIEFRLNRSLAGDACCPNCNALAWPIGEEGHESQRPSIKTSTAKTKEVRIRPESEDMDLGDQLHRVISLLRKQNDVSVSVLFRGRDPEHQVMGKAVLERLVDSLVPEHAFVKTPAHIATRRICCTLSPSKKSGGE
ncbi:translation initiation factor [Rubripirellula reticaptiva]|uniref:Translation initiation factor IF-3 n=1 Tax=Rubripirellula reticaptiva TaxID=2528013 RepID=A0A5C6FBA5_9BACT|nr:hypothetical protein [Rubripirellula reticaptiva]TWU57416.1 Translation initiation factor IF-3 [Rubripirellula reticaptiva]